MKRALSIMTASAALQGMPIQAEPMNNFGVDRDAPLIQCIKSAGENTGWGYELIVGESKKLTFRIFSGIPEIAPDVVATNDNGVHFKDFGANEVLDEVAGTDDYEKRPPSSEDKAVYGDGVMEVYERCYGNNSGATS